MSDKFQLGSYVWVPTGAASYTALLNTFSSDVGATPTVANEGIDYSKPMSAWVAAAQWAANGLAASPGGTSNTPVFALPLMSTSDTTTTTLQAFNNIASGADDSIWIGIVKAYEADGFKTMYIRPGWEMNGNWMPWAVTNEAEAQAYVAAFQHIADVVRSVAGIDVKMLWNPADTTNTAVPTQATYPGDAYVDSMATDIYSTLYPESLYDWSTGKMDTSIQQWWANPVNEEHYWDYPDATQYSPHGNGSGWGLVDALEFAVEHNKPFSLAETGAGDNGAALGPVDNGLFPEYLAQRLLAAGAPTIAFATLWERVGTSYEFTDGNHPLETAAWADFVRKMEQGDAGPSLSTATATAGHNQTTNLLSALNTLITPGRTGDTETITKVSAASGHVTMGANGAILYTAGAAGTDTLTYTVTDQLGDVINATTTLVIDGGPTINGAATKLGHSQTITMAKLGASLVTPGQAGDVESFSHVTSAHGTITVAADGTISYTAPASGTDTLSYTVTDQYGDSVTGSSTLSIDAGPILATAAQGTTPGAVSSLA